MFWQKLKKLFTASHAPPPAKPMASREKRSAVRKSQRLMQGYIWSERMAFSKPCAIRNVSAMGARIDLCGGAIKTHMLTGTITLYFHADKREIDCQVMWRTGRCIGVRFVGPFRLPTRQYGVRGAAS